MKKRILSLLLTCVLLCGTWSIVSVSAYSETDIAYPVEGGNIYFNKETGTITGCDQSVTKVEIPSEIDGVAVTSIGESAFSECATISSIVIPDSVTTIGQMAFHLCRSLSSVTLGENITRIENRVFHGCTSLTNVKIPESVTSIGDGAFYMCTSLSSVEIPTGVTSIGEVAFFMCNSLSSVEIPDSVERIEDGTFYECESLKSVAIPNSVTSIGEHAFYKCNSLSIVEIPDSVVSIGDGAFLECPSLKSIEIPKSVISIGENAFGYCAALTGIWVDDDNPAFSSDNYGVLFDKDKTVLITAPCKTPEIYSIPYGVKTIGKNAFGRCADLTVIEIPCTVTSIEEWAFFQCVSLSNAVLPDSVISIGDGAFHSCDSLTSMVIPEKTTSIGGSAFNGCDALTSVEIKGSVTNIADHTFFGCLALETVTLPDSVLSIDWNAFFACKSLAEITLGESVINIGKDAFCGCESLTSLTFGDSLSHIEDGAFWGCSSLHSAFFKGAAPTLGEEVFQTWDYDAEQTVNIPGLTLYYIEGKAGWTSPTWNGYPTATWVPHEHSYADTVTAPTCTEKGYTTHTCECGDNYVDTYVDALGHDFGEWTQTEAPTCTEKGEEKRTCSRCEAMETRELAALGHSYEDGVCVRCGEKEPQSPVEFVDVPKDEWYFGAVEYVAANGLMNGVGNGKFDPEGTMTRAMLVTVLWRYEGEPKAGANTFSDVPNGTWYTEAVAWAAANGIVGGIGNNRFDPEGKITREQMATILFRYANKKGIDVSKRGDLTAFPDGDAVESWAQEAMQWTVAEGIIGGSDGKLLPQGNATRAQVATILMRYIENIVKK